MNGQRETSRHPITYQEARRLVGLALLIVIGWFLIRALEPVLLLFAIAFLVAMVLNPLVVMLEKRRIPRGLAVAMIIVAALVLLGGLTFLAGPPLFAQVQELIGRTPAIWSSIRRQIESWAVEYPILRNVLPQADRLMDTIGSELGGLAAFLLRSTYTVFGAVLTALFGLLVFIFVLTNPQPIVAGYLALVPDSQRDRARRALARMMRQMSAWARGVAINGAIVGLSTGLLLALVGVQPAIVFGALAFLGEFVPTVGPVLISIPILILALSIGLTKFFLALAVVLFVQQVETTLLVPFVLGREMRLNPVVILFFTLAMGSIFGLAGVVLSLPAAALVTILVDEFYLRPRKLNEAALQRDARAMVTGEGSSDKTEKREAD